MRIRSIADRIGKQTPQELQTAAGFLQKQMKKQMMCSVKDCVCRERERFFRLSSVASSVQHIA